jgi:hypothetical protein
MNRTAFLLLSALLAGVLAVADTPSGRGDDRQPQSGPSQDGVEELATGPVHEAYADPAAERPQAGAPVPRQPPPPLVEAIPDQKPEGDGYEWIPGYWAWDEERSDFVWVSGIWRLPPPGQQWVPGHWVQADGGWQWAPGFWTPVAQATSQEIDYLPEPPPAQEEAVPTPAVADSVFVPGSWVYQDSQYLWQPGQWMAYRPGWVWTAPHYVWGPLGYRYIAGFWDYGLARRGLLFAPARIAHRFWNLANWVYRPRDVVGTNYLLGSLFARPALNRYYFGNYFDPRYRRFGFVGWTDYWVRRGYRDAMFGYYHWRNRADPRWERDLRQLYAGRFRGNVPRPPRTLAEQRALLRDHPDARNLAGLRPLARAGTPLHLLTAAERQEDRRRADALRDLGRQRQRQEARAGAGKVGKASVRLDVPRPPGGAESGDPSRRPPPRPTPQTLVKGGQADRPGNRSRPGGKSASAQASARPRPAGRQPHPKPGGQVTKAPTHQPPKPGRQPAKGPRPNRVAGAPKHAAPANNRPGQAHQAAKPHPHPQPAAKHPTHPRPKSKPKPHTDHHHK